MPYFEFQPWERLSDSVTDGEAHTRIDTNKKRWLFRQCGPICFCREARKTGAEHNFVLRGLAMTVNTAGEIHWQEPDRSNLESYVASDYHNENLARVWTLDDVLVCWSRSEEWLVFDSWQSCSHRQGGFKFCLAASGLEEVMPSSTAFAILQEEWDNAESALRSSAQILSVPLDERPLRCVTTCIDSPQKLVHVLHCALCTFSAMWTGEFDSQTLHLDAVGNGGRFVLEGMGGLGTRERAILNHIVRAFEPRQLPDSPALLSAKYALGCRISPHSFQVTQTCPSTHDKLEALLELRAWLSEHWPDGVRHLEKVV